MKNTGAEIFIEALRREGVEVIFGYPGGAVIPIYDVLYDSPLRHILTRHEQGAVHAADGYARSTGKVGVCLATSGPGATNLVTGLATAYMDSVPMVAFTGQVGTAMIGRDSFQEADITGITMPVTKHNYLVKDVRDIPRVVKEAFYIASTGRRGPVLVDLPKDITMAKIKPEYPEEVNLPGYKPTYVGNARQIKAAVRAIEQAKRPVLYIGGGVTAAGAEAPLLQLAERIQAPVTTTLMGLTAFPSRHPLSLGMLGMHGTVYANYAVTEADLLIAIGARFDDRVTGRVDTFAPQAKVIHIDIDPAEIGKNVRVDIPIVGDATIVIGQLLEELKELQHPEWLARIDEWKRHYPLRYNESPGAIAPQRVVETIDELTAGNAIITTEVGQNQMWAAQYLKFTKARSFVTSGGLGTMGFGFPAAVGAQVGNKDRLVVCIAGDGSFQMNMQELATLVAYQLPVKVVILNNGYLGMVRQWQELFFQKRYSCTELTGNPDFVKVAEAYGIKGYRIQNSTELKPVLAEAFRTPGPAVVDCVVAREENVFPMVPQNGSINKMLGVVEE
ncbi:MAG TPA: biosynthetic-type acetolactate synthase large subunit [Firmicutes bacterium]|jgi:acetolactate synthase-1/2/3 large subunit|nr:biosynthetic-type acetolactate synthase large subunit [Bacillota bacterium]HOQ24375.1 biosynthetic-type acetolactate synthase large subunit [Bacillota bacterium]HPT67656.1 biosynthetic-type acetolactate synthase large subunit [Bacillota bacterium]